jgi:hypothetical protein
MSSLNDNVFVGQLTEKEKRQKFRRVCVHNTQICCCLPCIVFCYNPFVYCDNKTHCCEYHTKLVDCLCFPVAFCFCFMVKCDDKTHCWEYYNKLLNCLCYPFGFCYCFLQNENETNV